MPATQPCRHKARLALAERPPCEHERLEARAAAVLLVGRGQGRGEAAPAGDAQAAIEDDEERVGVQLRERHRRARVVRAVREREEEQRVGERGARWVPVSASGAGGVAGDAPVRAPVSIVRCTRRRAAA